MREPGRHHHELAEVHDPRAVGQVDRPGVAEQPELEPEQREQPRERRDEARHPEPRAQQRVDRPDDARRAPASSATATGSGNAPFTQSTPISAEATPLIDPTERSISPSISTQTMPSAITPVVEQSKSMFTRLFDDRKIGLMAVKIVQMMTSPTITGSEPRSPDRTRSMKARDLPADPARRGRPGRRCGRASARWLMPDPPLGFGDAVRPPRDGVVDGAGDGARPAPRSRRPA